MREAREIKYGLRSTEAEAIITNRIFKTGATAEEMFDYVMGYLPMEDRIEILSTYCEDFDIDIDDLFIEEE